MTNRFMVRIHAPSSEEPLSPGSFFARCMPPRIARIRFPLSLLAPCLLVMSLCLWSVLIPCAAPAGAEEGRLSRVAIGSDQNHTPSEFVNGSGELVEHGGDHAPPAFLRLAAWVLLFLLPIVAGGWLWSRSLKAQVRQRTEEIRWELFMRNRAEESLRQSEQRYRMLFESAKDAILLLEKGLIVDCNPMALELFGCTRGEIIGKGPCDFSPQKQLDGVDSQWIGETKVALALQGSPQFFEWRHSRSDGSVFDTEVSLNSFELAGRLFIMAIIRDITDRKLAADRLKQANDYLENVLESSPDAVCILDRHGNFIKLNRMAVGMFAYSFEDLVGRNVAELYANPEEGEKIVTKLRSEGAVKGYEVNIRRGDGTILPVDLSASLLRDNDANTIGCVAIARDLSDIRKANEQLRMEIAERRRVEKALRESENTYRTVFENTGTATVILDEDTGIILANAECEKLSGYTKGEISGGKSWTEFIAPDDLEKMKEYHLMRRVDPDSVPPKYECHFVNKAGELRNIICTVAMIPGTTRSVASLTDITERRKMEEELLKAQKLESVGVLAGGIAHDFNNILTAIIGNISLAKMYTRPGDEIFPRLKETEKACLRAKDLTQQLLTFSKGGAPVKRTVVISELVKDSCVFASRGSNIQCELSIPDSLWPVDVDEGQISQVMNNLIINADQAMPQGGTIRVGVRNVVADAAQGLPLASGRYIMIAVEDEGIGIPKEHLPRIFDPYFTTKPTGSGLGLATVYSIVNKHGGYIKVESEVGEGTTLLVYLPASANEVAEAAAVETEPTTSPGKVRILVMDDEEIVRTVVGQMLDYMAYEVAFAGDGDQAAEMYRKGLAAGRPFGAVILDLTIPGGKGGRETIEDLLKLDPSVKAIASSGYSNDPILSDFEQYGFRGVVAKPYRIQDLSEALRRVLADENG